MVWQDEIVGNDDILYRRSLNGGTTFPNIIKNLSGEMFISNQPGIAVKGGNVYVVWEVGGSDIIYRRSTDDGETFFGITINLSTMLGGSGA